MVSAMERPSSSSTVVCLVSASCLRVFLSRRRSICTMVARVMYETKIEGKIKINKLRLSWAKLKFCLVKVVDEV